MPIVSSTADIFWGLRICLIQKMNLLQVLDLYENIDIREVDIKPRQK